MLYIVPAFIIIRYHLKDKLKYGLIIIAIAVMLVISSLIPLVPIPSSIQNAENQFRDLYGDEYSELNTNSMLQEPFSLWKQYNIMPSENAELDIRSDVVYHDNGADKFHFDYYAPKEGAGPFPVIIAVHGGAWFLGNKGPINNVPFSKYIASKGYVVFDLQYGLADIDKAADSADLELISDVFQSVIAVWPKLQYAAAPDYNQNYMMQDQVANIGQFTKFLATNADEYRADLSKTFILGRSAGAHIASVVGTGYDNPKFAGTFSDQIRLKGIILYYPPTDIKKMRDAMAEGRLGGYPKLAPAFNEFIDDGTLSAEELEKEYEKYSAAYLIQDDVPVPPIIIFHGSADGIVPYQEQGVDFQAIAKENERDSIFITIPNTGHAFDAVSPQDAGWQISSYYAERFIALEVD